MTLEVVLVGDWQHECCGDVVAIGDVVTWRLERDFDREWVARTFGAQQASRLAAIDERHGDESPSDEVVRGRVVGLSSVMCLLSASPESGGLANRSVEDGGRIESRQAMVRWEPAREDERWAGYIVDLERT